MISTSKFVVHELGFSEMQEYTGDQINYLSKLSQQKGKNVHLKMMGMNIYMTADADMVQPLLIKNVDKVHRDPFSRKMFKRMVGEGVIVAEGETWKSQRTMLQPAFHSQRIGAYADTMVEYTGDMLKTWHSGDTLEIDEVMNELTQRIIVKTMFNRDIASFTSALGDAMQTMLTIADSQLKSLPLPEWLPTIPRWKQQQARNKITDLIDGIITDRKNDPQDYGDLLSMLLNARDEDGKALSHEQIQDECLTLFIAGHETTAVTLTWALHLLSNNPNVMTKLQQEVDSVLEDKAPTLEDFGKLAYTEMVIKEALRLYPPAWSLGRIALENMHLNESPIQKDGIVFLNIYLLHRQAEYFPDPEAFLPERFDKNNEPSYPRYAYMPFGAGRRICIGNQFAMLEAVMLLSRIMQEYTVSPASDAEVIAEPTITLRPVGGLKLTIQKR